MVIISAGLNLVEPYLYWEGQECLNFSQKTWKPTLAMDPIQNAYTAWQDGEYSHVHS